MNRKQQQKDVVDEAARARKLLAKNETPKLSALKKTSLALQQGATQNLGEHLIVAVVSATSTHQYVISHPVGVTGLTNDSWVINDIDHIASMLTRRENPGRGALNQQRSKHRTQLAVDHGYLKVVDDDPSRIYYSNRDDKTRNELLEEARLDQKARKSELELLLEKEKDGRERARIRADIDRAADVVYFMDDATAEVEIQLRSYWKLPEVVQEIENLFPETYRTLTGPFGDQPQREIHGSRGLALDAVANAVSKKIYEMSIVEPKPVVSTDEGEDTFNSMAIDQKVEVGPGKVQSTQPVFTPKDVPKAPPGELDEVTSDTEDKLTGASEPGDPGKKKPSTKVGKVVAAVVDAAQGAFKKPPNSAPADRGNQGPDAGNVKG